MAEPTNLADILRRDVAPTQPWVINVREDETECIVTWQQARSDAAAIARALARYGLGRGDAVAIIAGNSAEYLIVYIGIMLAGMVAVPVNHQLPKETLQHVLADSGAKLAFVDQERRAIAGDVPAMALGDLADDTAGALSRSDPFEPCLMRPEEVATILYTSGSTGVPKGVPLTHGGYLWATSRYEHLSSSISGQKTLIAAPLYHMNALFLSKLLMRLGGTNVLMSRFEAASYLRAIDRHRCAIITSVPTMLALVAQEKDLLRQLDLGCVIAVLTGSAPVTEELLRRVQAMFPNALVSNSWGATESGPVCFGPHPQGLPRPLLSLGHPQPDVEVRLIGGPSPVQGVLHVRTRALMTGYLHRPEDTAKCLKDGWYDTGDVMRRDANGFYFFVGRADDRITCGGENVYPSEVEAVLERHPDVLQAVVVPVPDEIKHQLPVAFVVPRPETRPSADAIKQFSLQNCPAYAHPRAVFVVSELPLLGTNKIDRKLLMARAHALFARAQGSAA